MYICNYQNEGNFLNVTYNDIFNNGLVKNKCVVLNKDNSLEYLDAIYHNETVPNAPYYVEFCGSFKYGFAHSTFSAASPDDSLKDVTYLEEDN